MSDEENESGAEEGNIEIYLRIKPIANPSKKVEYDLTEGKVRGAAANETVLALCWRTACARREDTASCVAHGVFQRAGGCMRPAVSPFAGQG